MLSVMIQKERRLKIQKFVTFEKIEEQFGATVRRIVEGETKVLYFCI